VIGRRALVDGRQDDGSKGEGEADPADGSRQQGGGADAAAAAAHHAAQRQQGPAPTAPQFLRLVQHDPRQEGARGDLQERGTAAVRPPRRDAEQQVPAGIFTPPAAALSCRRVKWRWNRSRIVVVPTT